MSIWDDIDLQLSHALNEGRKAFDDGLTKFDNPYEPGCLSFDMWLSGFNNH